MNKTEESFKKGYKFRIYPTIQQQELLAKTFGSCRYLWNVILDETTKEYEEYISTKESNTTTTTTTTTTTKPNLSGFSLSARIVKHKANPESIWLSEVSYNALQQTVLSLGDAYSNYFKSLKGIRKGRIGRPKFKKKYSRQSFRLVGTGFRVKDGQLYIAKLKEPIRVLWSRELPSEPSSLVISKTPSGEYYASFICEYVPTKTSGTEQIGIDVGLTTYATLSSGETIDNPRWLKHHLRSLRRQQKALSRRKKGSSNYKKQRNKVAYLHKRVSNSRHDWQHKLSRTLVNKSHVIGVEGLKVANMIQNHKLSKAIADVSWSSFFSKLQYKVKESGHATLIYIGQYFPSSHICSETGKMLDRKLKLSERSWDCPHCGGTHDRDLNAALNIRNKTLELYHQLVESRDMSGEVYVVSG